MKISKFIVPLILSMAFFIFSAICVYGATCTVCNGSGSIITNSVTEERDCTYCDNGYESVPLECEYCDGVGQYKCDKCYGLGELESGQNVDCDKCNGRGYFVHDATYINIDCPLCNGGEYVSTVDCSKCTDGFNNCTSCKGSGKEWRDAVYNTIKCEMCEGKGKVTQEDIKCELCYNGVDADLGECDSCGGIFSISDYVSNNFFTPCCSWPSYSDVSCSNCSGEGYYDSVIICNLCSGKGTITETLYESGYYTCSVCNNVDGKVKCSTCNGVGTVSASITCDKCDGVGYTVGILEPAYNEDCADCDNGKVTVWENVTCSDCFGNGYVDCNVCENGLVFNGEKCSHCNGKGTFTFVVSQGQTVTCSTCKGTGNVPSVNPDIEVNNFYDYCTKHGLLPFDYYDDDYAYVYWYYSDISSFMLLALPENLGSNLPIWLDSYDTVCLLEWDSLYDTYFYGYMWNTSTQSWQDNIEAWGKSLDSPPQILYSDVDIWCYNGEDFILSYDGLIDYDPSGLGSGGGSSDKDDTQNFFEKILSTVTSGFTSLSKTIGDGLINIVSHIRDLFTELFVPSFNPLTELFDLMHEKVPISTQLYVFVGNFINLCNDFDFTDYEPKIVFNFGGAFGVNDEMNVFDLSWYKPYRDTVNGILSAFLWLTFAFSIYKKIPSILGGID